MTVPLKAAAAVRGSRKGTSGRSRQPGPLRHQPNNLNTLPADWHEEELEARKQDAQWAAAERKAGRDPDRSSISGESDEETAPASDGPSPTSSGGGPSMPSIPAPVQSGSGFLLGVFAWAVGLAYLQGGSAGVKKFMAAKFFNKV